MRLLAGSLLPALCLATSATPPTAFTYDSPSKPVSFGTLDPVAARLVLAQRTGVENYHNADLERQGVIDAVNTYGTRQSLFASKDSATRRALILLEGEAKARADSILREQAGFQIVPTPEALETRSLFVDLARQSQPHSKLDVTDDEFFAQLSKVKSVPQDGDLFYVAESADDFEATFARLIKEGSWSITALSAPPHDEANVSPEKGQWGTYEMPHSQSLLKKRQQKEEPLTGTTQYKPIHSTSVPFTPLADSTPLRGILPACYTSQSACESATRNCTGHGGCSRKYHDESARGNKDCFSCVCRATKSADGKTTTQWAGPACQKKDISVQFWLITLFTVALIFVVGFAIGQIWEMGEQELPSVIGAGVSGPSARK